MMNIFANFHKTGSSKYTLMKEFAPISEATSTLNSK